MARLLLALSLILTAFAAPAQERPRTILVLDGSGSMWGQIDGINKIVIAREVIGSLLQDFPPDQELGLTVYGHRRKGDCNDIETLIAPGLGTTGAIAGAVNSINPKGKTPLSAAVMAAAEALRYGEEKATVILVSDGIETCNVDPCEVGRMLEETGVDFTAHVVGFDVQNDPQALAQLQCLAEETGGIFRTAANASELTEALQVVSEPPAPDPVDTTLAAVEGIGGPQVTEGLSWTVTNPLGIPILSGVNDAAPVLPLDPGDYKAIVQRDEDDARAEQTFTVADADQRVVLVLPELVREVPVSFSAVAGIGGPRITEGLTWTVSDATGTPVLADASDAGPSLPLEPGDYTATVTRAADDASAEQGFTVAAEEKRVVLVLPELPPEPVDVTVFATDGRHGPRISDPLIWDLTGPDGAILTSEQTPSLDLDLTKGTYTVSVMRPADEAFAELRFGVGSVDKTVTLELPEFRPLATLDLPETAVAGATIQVGWTGPDERDDYIAVSTLDDGAGASINYARTREGSPLALQMPPTPGTYEVSYVLRNGRKELVTETIEITPVEATLAVSGDLIAGNTVQVDWTGPDYRDDYIAVTESGGTDTINYARTRDGTPLNLQLPPRPGTYDILYVMRQDRTVLARMTVEVSEIAATLDAPATATTGDTVSIGWTGPDYRDDYIAVVAPGETDTINYTRTRDGAPLNLQMPAEPGTYEIVYIMRQDRRPLARHTIEVSDVSATLDHPTEATVGDTIQVDWTGPDYRDDYIAVVAPGETDTINYARTRDGSPLGLQMPTEPGTYEILYVMRQGRTVLARSTITVSGVTATLDHPTEATVGDTIQVDWTGPDYRDDYIAVVAPGETDTINYNRTRAGSPLGLQMPTEPGTYEILYVMRQGRTVLARSTITVSEVTATLDHPAEAPTGATISVDWTGPDYNDDYIAVVAPGETDTINYNRTRAGAPLDLQLPSRPGTYEIVYVMRQGRTVLARSTISVTEIEATLSAPSEAMAGASVTVDWTGPDYHDDYIAVVNPGEIDTIEYTRTRSGAPLELKMPSEPGTYEIVYIMRQDRTPLARVSITVTETDASLSAPSTGAIGATVTVDWTGPDYKDDYIAVTRPGETDALEYTYTRAGAPLDLRLPNEPGDYEIAYVMRQDRTVLARTAISVTETDASLSAPETGTAGADIEVTWTGPGYDGDYLAVTAPGSNDAITYSYTRDGSTLSLTLPSEPGAYEIAYILDQGRKPLTRTPITVSEVTATLTPPAELPAGATVPIDWTGPDYQGDYIGITQPGGTGWINYAYTRDGSPAQLTLPGTPGDYDITYVMNQDRTVLARTSVTVTEVSFSVSAPASAPAGSSVEVTWAGPDYQGDYIAIAQPGAAPGRYTGYTYTREGSPLTLDMPPQPGTYEIRYILGQDRLIEATTTIEVTPVDATLDGPTAAPAGSDITVDWTGPGYGNDYIAIAPAGAPQDDYTAYAYTRTGNPVTVTLPTAPGDWELRYVMGSGGRTVLASQPITLEEITATLDAPATAPAGGTLAVGWTGPGYRSDYIALGRPGEDASLDYFYTRSGPTGELALPDTPGAYEIRYVLGQGQTPLLTQPLTVE